MLELERAELMPVPAPFDGYVERPARVSSTWSASRNRYSVPCEYAGKWVSSRLYPTRIEVVADDALIASHVRLLDRDQVSYDWQHYLPLIERKPGALRNGAPFADLPAPLRQLKHGLSAAAVTGSWRKFWLPYRSPGSMRCWWLLSWYWKAAA